MSIFLINLFIAVGGSFCAELFLVIVSGLIPEKSLIYLYLLSLSPKLVS
jgi:hypothetical protein